MSKDRLYLNEIDHQLSKITGNDQEFKQELATIYSEYMRVIPRKFITIIEEKDRNGLTQLHHKHKTTCHVLSLQELSETFVKAKRILSAPVSLDEEHTLSGCVEQVITICNDTLAQLQEITRS